MKPNYNISIRFDEPLIERWKAHQRHKPTETLSGVVKTLLRAYLDDPGAITAKLRKPTHAHKAG